MKTKSDIIFLILEDDPEDFELMRRVLYNAFPFAEIRHADDEETFLRMLQLSEPSVILADYYLPNFSGLDAILCASQFCPGVPFIFVSGAISEEFAEDTVLNNGWAFVLKSHLDELPRVIKNTLFKQQIDNQLGQNSSSLLSTTQRIQDQIETNRRLLDRVNGFINSRREPLEGDTDFDEG